MNEKTASHDALVSAIIPVYNGEQYLGEAIQSVLNQTYRPVEIIVIDDGSSDGSAAVAQRFGSAVRCEIMVHSGAGGTRNRGIELGRGSFFAFLDADDLWEPEKLALQMCELQNNPELDMVFAHARQFHSPELSLEAKANLKGHDTVQPGGVTGTLLIRRESILRAPRFETGWRLGEFIDWYLKATESGLKSRMMPQVLLQRRLHLTNTGIRERHARADYVRVMKASLDRRRA